MAERTKVFISYSHDSPEHVKRVLDLADALRHGGLEVILDQYVHPAPDEGWPPWKSATTAWGPSLEKARESRLQSVIAMALPLGGGGRYYSKAYKE
jgi:hypothetical protein